MLSRFHDFMISEIEKKADFFPKNVKSGLHEFKVIYSMFSRLRACSIRELTELHKYCFYKDNRQEIYRAG